MPTISYIDNMLKNINIKKGSLTSINQIIKYIGYSFGVIIFIAEYFPLDVEYTLGQSDDKLCFDVLDFGMTEKINFTNSSMEYIRGISHKLIDDIDIDLYYPSESSYIDIFKLGFKDAYEKSIKSDSKKLVFENFIELYS